MRTNAHFDYDAVVVGSGPNGLAAAITLAQAGCSVLVLEAADAVGGGLRSAELTLPGFVHDICSTVHPLGAASPVFRPLGLERLGLTFVYPPAPLAHPLDDGQAVLVDAAIETTAARLGSDAEAYRRLWSPLIADSAALLSDALGPLRWPAHPLRLARFGVQALQPAATLARRRLRTTAGQALFAGLAAHAILPLEWPATAAFGLVLGMLAHAVGWPVVRGGSQRFAEALAACLRGLGGQIVTGHRVASLVQLPSARATLLDVTPRQFIHMAGDRLPPGYRRRLARFQYGPGVFKLDYVLDSPVPWRAPECTAAATVHIGGSLEEIALAERLVWRGQHPERPFVLLVQPSLFDPTRAPAGKHTVWAYCHVPHGSNEDMTARVEAQIERFAPGFRERILARSARTPAALEAYNPNYVGGDINGGAQHWRQLFTRPTARVSPYTTPLPGVYLCSSSTPPGGGVHGMCGWYAARAALRRL